VIEPRADKSGGGRRVRAPPWTPVRAQRGSGRQTGKVVDAATHIAIGISGASRTGRDEGFKGHRGSTSDARAHISGSPTMAWSQTTSRPCRFMAGDDGGGRLGGACLDSKRGRMARTCTAV